MLSLSKHKKDWNICGAVLAKNYLPFTVTTKLTGVELHGDGYGGKDENFDVRNTVVEQIWLRNNQGVDKTIANLAHEAFVHVAPDQNRLIALRKELNNGTIKPGTKEYGIRLEEIARSGQVDHDTLSKEKVQSFKNFSLQMDLIKNATKFIKSYNDEVKKNQ